MPVPTLFSGCATALVTPFLSGGAIDKAALRHLIQLQLDAGIDALVLLGTTGEPSTLTMEERERIILIAHDVLKGQIPLIVGTGSNDTHNAIQFAKQAQNLGAQGQLIVTPYYNKATQAGLVRHFSAILDSCSLPAIFYNVPSRTGMSISAQTAAELSSHPNAAGIKEASGSVSLAADILHLTHGELPLYCGNDELILPLMALGAKGAISVCSNAAPVLTKSLTHACLENRFIHAREIYHSLLPLIQALFTQVNPIPVKAALAMMELIGDELRLPLTPLEEPYRQNLKKTLKHLHLIS